MIINQLFTFHCKSYCHHLSASIQQKTMAELESKKQKLIIDTDPGIGTPFLSCLYFIKFSSVSILKGSIYMCSNCYWWQNCFWSLKMWWGLNWLSQMLNFITPLVFFLKFRIINADDAMAIFVALQSPKVEVIGLTTIYGNVYTTLATRNALHLVLFFYAFLLFRNFLCLQTKFVPGTYKV